MKRVGIYLRVSTSGQTTENQRRELEAVVARSGWELVCIYEDVGISGAARQAARVKSVLKDATARKVNMIAALSVDRLGRSLQDLLGFLTDLHALGCHLYLHQQALDTSTPSGRGHVSDVRRLCRVRARHDPRAGQCGPRAGQEARHQIRSSSDQVICGSAHPRTSCAGHGRFEDREDPWGGNVRRSACYSTEVASFSEHQTPRVLRKIPTSNGGCFLCGGP
jgi:hypothetical protein